MMRNHLFWFKAGAWMCLLTAAAHSLNFLSSPQPQNDTEKQLLDLMSNYRFELPGGFIRSMADLMMYFNLNMTVYLLFQGVINLMVLKYFMPSAKDRALILWNFFILTANLVSAWQLTFIAPIALIGICWLCFGLAFIFFKSPGKANVAI